MDLKYEIIFRGCSYKQRMIEVYLPEYKHSQIVTPTPLIGCDHIFGFFVDDFWRAHKELDIEIRNILRPIAYKHLWFLMCWDLASKDEWHTFECWKFWVDEYIKRFKGFKPNEEEYQMCLDSFYNKYEKIGKTRKYKFIE